MRKWQQIGRVFLPLALLAFLLTGCGDLNLTSLENIQVSALDPKGPVAAEQLSLILISLAIMIFVFVVVMIIFTYVLVRFRHRPGKDHEIPKQVEGSHKLEVIWTVIPILLLLVLAFFTVQSTFTLAEDYSEEEGTLIVNVNGHQYWWEFQYPEEGIVTAQELYIPTGQKVQLYVASKDVIHSFWIPSLAGKVDMNPGLVNRFYIEADEPGLYQGRCAELCGASHALMDFKVIALEPAAFEQWVQKMSTFTDEPQTALADMGREVFVNNCIGCHAIDANQSELFGHVLGPNLAGFGSRDSLTGVLRNNPEDLERWIREGQSVKPENKMPEFGLDIINQQEMEALIEYLQSLTLE